MSPAADAKKRNVMSLVSTLEPRPDSGRRLCVPDETYVVGLSPLVRFTLASCGSFKKQLTGEGCLLGMGSIRAVLEEGISYHGNLGVPLEGDL